MFSPHKATQTTNPLQSHRIFPQQQFKPFLESVKSRPATSRAMILPGTAWRHRGEKRFSQCLAKYSASKRCGNAPLALFSKIHFSVGAGPLAGASGAVDSKTLVILLFPHPTRLHTQWLVS